jgi:crotonobetainyl-CoA:carnitine CoA-transferase CaiB-like acyl-CoA transferase
MLPHKSWHIKKQAEDAVLSLGGWQDLIKGNLKYQLCLTGPHPTLQLLAMTLSLAPSLTSDALFIPEDEGVEALDLFKSVFKSSIEPNRVLNPIELLDTLSCSDSLDLCPFVYGYVNYSTESSNLCATSPLGGKSILGGTGIAITQRCTVNNDLLIYLKKLLSPNVQSAFIPNNGGQPSFQSAWSEANINQNSNDFYKNAFSTVNGVHLRPRHPGYTHFQDKAAHLIRHSLFNNEPSRYTIKKSINSIQKLRSPAMEQALSDVTILDFSQLLQDPFATQMLGDIGANVIKVERPVSGDLFRSMTFNHQWVGGKESPNFLAWNRNKRSIAVNLKSEESKAILYRLVGQADIVVENFRPGVMDRLGYGYDDLKAINPKLIYCSETGYGDSGPYVERPGQDMLVQGPTGQASQPPTPAGSGFSDQVGAMNIVYSVLSALYWRERSGKGQKIVVNLLAGMLAHQGQEMLMAMNFNQDFQRPNSGIGHPGMDAPFGTYPTSDGWVTIAMSPFKTLVKVLGDDSLLKYDDPATLLDQRDNIWNEIAKRTRAFDTQTLMSMMLAEDIWCGEFKSHLEAADDPQVKHLGLIQ